MHRQNPTKNRKSRITFFWGTLRRSRYAETTFQAVLHQKRPFCQFGHNYKFFALFIVDFERGEYSHQSTFFDITFYRSMLRRSGYAHSTFQAILHPNVRKPKQKFFFIARAPLSGRAHPDFVVACIGKPHWKSKKSNNFFLRHATLLSLRGNNFSGRFTPETPFYTRMGENPEKNFFIARAPLSGRRIPILL